MKVSRSEGRPAPAAPATSDRTVPDRTAHRRFALAAVLVIVGVGVVLRFVAFSPLWLDEALSVNIARLPLADIPDALRQDGHPPLFYFMLHLWMRVFGEGDLAARTLSGVLSVAALPLMWLVARRLGGRQLAWVSVLVLAVAPFAIRYATETRMYSLLVVLVLAGHLLVTSALRRPYPATLLGIAAVSGALLLTHYWSFWLVASVGVVLLVRYRMSEGERHRATGRVLLAVAAGGLLFLPWLPVFLHQAANTGTPWATVMRPSAVVAATLTDFGGGVDDLREAELAGALLLILALLGLFGRAVDRTHIDLDLSTRPQLRTEAALIALTVLLGVGASYVTSTTYATRYAAVFFPLVILLVAGGVTRFASTFVRALVLGLVIFFGLVGGVYNAVTDRTQAEVLADAIGDLTTPGDVVVYCPDQLGPAFGRLLPGGLDHVTYPLLSGPERVDWQDYAERHAAADPGAVATQVLDRAGDNTVWVVWSPAYRTLEGQCEALVDAFLAARPEGSLVVAEDVDFFESASLHRFPRTP